MLPFRYRRAVSILAAGGVVASPTEAVWGLSCDPFNAHAIDRLLRLKRRPPEKGLILVASETAHFAALLESLPPQLQQKMSLSWPGPNTWLVPHNNCVPAAVHGDHDTVAIRVSAHPAVQMLCSAWGGPLVSSSANVAGKQAPRALFQVVRYFGQLDAIVPGRVGDALRPSTIRHVFTDQIIRA